MNPLAINDAIAILYQAGVETVKASDFAWRKTYNATKYLELQLAEYFADAEVAA